MIVFDCALSRGRFNLDAAFSGSGGIIALFGPSGSGKSTIVRLIAGLERPERGLIQVGHRTLIDTSRRIAVPVHRRRVGLVFQDGQLLPHLTVRQNLLYGRHFRTPDANAISLDDVVGLLGISHLLGSVPRTLSGGERQRVAIGRALLASPEILLLDEPLASLDTERKLEILPFIERLRDETALPIVYVSHAMEEVARLAAKVVKLAEGRVVASGMPSEVLSPSLMDASADRFETVSMITGTFARALPEFGVTIVAHPAGEIVVPGRVEATSATVRISVRATNVALALGKPEQSSVRTVLAGRVTQIRAGEGPFALVEVELEGGDRIVASATRLAVAELNLQNGSEVFALIKAVSMDELGISGLRPSGLI
jgi:molybdate transport system ATP-binding protein